MITESYTDVLYFFIKKTVNEKDAFAVAFRRFKRSQYLDTIDIEVALKMTYVEHRDPMDILHDDDAFLNYAREVAVPKLNIILNSYHSRQAKITKDVFVMYVEKEEDLESLVSDQIKILKDTPLELAKN